MATVSNLVLNGSRKSFSAASSASASSMCLATSGSASVPPQPQMGSCVVCVPGRNPMQLQQHCCAH
eukprot:13273954-Alexandrium_andersonii.AAC.1